MLKFIKKTIMSLWREKVGELPLPQDLISNKWVALTDKGDDYPEARSGHW